MEIEHALRTKRVITRSHLSVVTWDGTSDAYVLQHAPSVPGVREGDGILILGVDQLETLRDILTEAAEHHDT